MCSSAHPWKGLGVSTIIVQHEIIRKQWKLTYLVSLVEFDQECLLYAVLESNEQVRLLKCGKDGYKNDENVDA